ncbi:hypothetical protein FOVSG1_006842 [Fusarium oxysporum f. sp. vasinfectum]
MLCYDGTGFTRVEADYSKPWLPGESRPEATPGEDYSRPWLPGEERPMVGSSGWKALARAHLAVNPIVRHLAHSGTSGYLVTYKDIAAPEEVVPNTLGYVAEYLSVHRTDAILLEGGSVVNLVNQSFINRSGLYLVLLAHTEPIRLANDKVAQVSEFLTLEVVVANIMCLLIAYVVQGHEDWDLLVGPPWLRRGHSALIDITPSPEHFRAINNHRKDESERPQGLAELEEEELIYVDDDSEIKAEVEGILTELHDAIQQATDAYHLSGNEEPPSVKP